MRLALCRPDRVGDVILATACLEPIRRQFPDVRLFFMAREVMRPLLEGHPLLRGGGFLALPLTRGWSGCHALSRALRERWVDTLIHLHPDKFVQLAGRLARVSRQVGYRSSPLLDLFTLSEFLPDRRRSGHKHEAEYNFDLLATLGVHAPVSTDRLRPRVHLAERWRELLLAKFADFRFDAARPYLVINPTAFSPDLRWPPAHFVHLARELRAARPELTLVLIADRADDPWVLEIRRALGPAPWLLDLAGRTNLGELGWLLHGARAQVSRDTGTGHLAAAVGCPVVQIFGRPEPIYGPGRWRVLGEPGRSAIIEPPPVARRRGEAKRAFWRRRLAAIPPEEVLAATLALLG